MQPFCSTAIVPLGVTLLRVFELIRRPVLILHKLMLQLLYKYGSYSDLVSLLQLTH